MAEGIGGGGGRGRERASKSRFEVRVLVSVRPGELRRWEKHNLVDEDAEDADEKFAGRDAACRQTPVVGGSRGDEQAQYGKATLRD